MISPDAMFVAATLVLSDSMGRKTAFDVESFSMGEFSIYADGRCEIKVRGYLHEAYPQTIEWRSRAGCRESRYKSNDFAKWPLSGPEVKND
jgi:hypothetical protein